MMEWVYLPPMVKWMGVQSVMEGFHESVMEGFPRINDRRLLHESMIPWMDECTWNQQWRPYHESTMKVRMRR